MTPYLTFCTVVMNRIEHLQQTLPINLANNNHPATDFLILDYNSSDGIGEWIGQKFDNEIASGRLKYYRTVEPILFHRSHSRNMAFRLAEGQVVCNVDGDNFLGPNFDRYIVRQFFRQDDIFLTPTPRKFNSTKLKDLLTGEPDAIGRIVVKKDDFLSIGGFDERFSSYGFEDFDLINRLELNGLRRRIIHDKIFLQAIQHDNQVRIANSETYDSFFGVFICHETFCKSRVLFVYNDKSCYSGTIIDNKNRFAENMAKVSWALGEDNYILEEQQWEKGEWSFCGDRLQVVVNDRESLIFRVTKARLTSISDKKHQSHVFFKIFDKETFFELLFFKATVQNRHYMYENLNNKRIHPNSAVFGSGIAYKNHDLTRPVQL